MSDTPKQPDAELWALIRAYGDCRTDCEGAIAQQYLKLAESNLRDALAAQAEKHAAELAQARTTAQHWKAEHLAGNDVIAALRAQVDALRAAGAALLDQIDANGSLRVACNNLRAVLDAASKGQTP